MIDLISFLVPIAFLMLALILALLLASQVKKQQKQGAPIRKYQSQRPTRNSTHQPEPLPKSIQSSNTIGAVVAINAVANGLAIYLIHTGVPNDRAYVMAYMVVACGASLFLPAYLETKLLGEDKPNQTSGYTVPPPPPTAPTLLGGLDFSKPHPLKVQLLAMVGGHQPTAARLLTQAIRENPGRQIDWYYDKVIQDLIRDRR